MQIIISHMNTDFDALASMIAAKKLYPDAQIVMSDKQDIRVKQFLNIYRETIEFVTEKQINWEDVTEIILVDVASLKRCGHFADKLQMNNLKITLYDHHPVSENNVKHNDGIMEQVGATVTLLLEEIKKRQLKISEFEATIFGLGIYTDTGFFTYKTTTARDFEAASYLMENGMNLNMIQRFSEERLDPNQQQLLDQLFMNVKSYEIDGLEIMVSTYQQEDFQGGLATLTQKLLEMKGSQAMIAVVGMKNNVFIVGRANSERINLLPFLKKWGGGGHKQAGSAMIKQADFMTIEKEAIENLSLILKPAITARDIMASPVKTLTPETTIEEAGQLMYRYGHSGYPIVENNKLIGMITRRDLDKANHHGLGHAPVKAYMTTKVISIQPETTLEEIQKIIIQHNIGRLPIVNKQGILEGIVSRTNIIKVIHEQTETPSNQGEKNLKENLAGEMQSQLPEQVFSILTNISEAASKQKLPVYLIGGIVRDIILQVPNDDVDIAVEGNGITFAKALQATIGGEVVVHEEFGTATWEHPSKLKIDIASSRLEYYDKPAALPDVERSTLQEDLLRRDFTINAMAICLNKENFGDVIDPYLGQKDLQEKKIKVLHNLSFVEDPTRIFRAVRFEARFQFKMDEETKQFALNSIEKVKSLSPNRVIHEMQRLFLENEPEAIIQRLFELNFWQQYSIKGENQSVCENHAQQLTTLYKMNAEILGLGENPSWFAYFVIPFYQGKTIEMAEKFALTKKNNKLLQEITDLQCINWNEEMHPGDLHRKLHDFSVESILFVIAGAEETVQNKLVTYLQKRVNLTHYITAEDLKQLGLRPGPIYKEIFFELEIGSLNGELSSREEAVDRVEQFIKKGDYPK